MDDKFDWRAKIDEVGKTGLGNSQSRRKIIPVRWLQVKANTGAA